MFEPEDAALPGVERPSQEGFIAVIVNKAGDVTRVDDPKDLISFLEAEPFTNISCLK